MPEAKTYTVVEVTGQKEWQGAYGPRADCGKARKVRWLLDEGTGCWDWQLYKIPTGYGQVRVANRLYPAHRFYYEEKYGPVPEGYVLDHLCRNRGCVNPDHLEPVTQRENVRRGEGTKLTLAQVQWIRSSSRSARSLALELGMDPSHFSKIRRAEKWDGLKEAA
jgi:hypothetical protein